MLERACGSKNGWLSCAARPVQVLRQKLRHRRRHGKHMGGWPAPRWGRKAHMAAYNLTRMRTLGQIRLQGT